MPWKGTESQGDVSSFSFFSSFLCLTPTPTTILPTYFPFPNAQGGKDGEDGADESREGVHTLEDGTADGEDGEDAGLFLILLFLKKY